MSRPNDIGLRVAYLFTCMDCGKEEVARFTFNPMQDIPRVDQCVPEGWSLSIFGSSSQTPVVLCGCGGSGPEMN